MWEALVRSVGKALAHEISRIQLPIPDLDEFARGRAS